MGKNPHFENRVKGKSEIRKHAKQVKSTFKMAAATTQFYCGAMAFCVP